MAKDPRQWKRQGPRPTLTNLRARRVREAALCEYIVRELSQVLTSLTATRQLYGNSSQAVSETATVLQSLKHQMEARLASLSSQEEPDTSPTAYTQMSFG